MPLEPSRVQVARVCACAVFSTGPALRPWWVCRRRQALFLLPRCVTAACCSWQSIRPEADNADAAQSWQAPICMNHHLYSSQRSGGHTCGFQGIWCMCAGSVCVVTWVLDGCIMCGPSRLCRAVCFGVQNASRARLLARLCKCGLSVVYVRPATCACAVLAACCFRLLHQIPRTVADGVPRLQHGLAYGCVSLPLLQRLLLHLVHATPVHARLGASTVCSTEVKVLRCCTRWGGLCRMVELNGSHQHTSMRSSPQHRFSSQRNHCAGGSCWGS